MDELYEKGMEATVESHITEGLFSIYWRLVKVGVDPGEVVILIKGRFWRELHEDLRANAEFQGVEYVEREEVVINERLRVRLDGAD